MSGFISSKSGLKIPVLDSDPIEYEDGMIWYNSSTGLYRMVIEGNVESTITGASDSWQNEVLLNGVEDEILLSWPTSFNAASIKFNVLRDGETEVGEIIVASNATSASKIEDRVFTSNIGLTFTVDVIGGNVNLYYSLSLLSNNANFKYLLTKW